MWQKEVSFFVFARDRAVFDSVDISARVCCVFMCGSLFLLVLFDLDADLQAGRSFAEIR